MFATPFERKTPPIVLLLCLLYLVTMLAPMAQSQGEPVADEKIIVRYKQMLERKPKEGSTFDRLYQFYLEGDGLEQMVADYQTEAAAKPNAPNIQLILGHIHKRLGKDAETLSAYQRAVELAPDDYYPHFALGRAYAMLRRHEDAIAALTQAAERATASKTATLDDLTALYKTLGRAYFSRDRGDDAILAWAKIAELDPENIFARIELADLFREQELYDQAIAQHQAIAELKTDDPYRVCMSHREIGKLQEEKGDYENALTSYDAALALTAPGNWLRKDLQHRIVGMYAADGNWEGLIEYYNGKLEARPNDPELMGLLASAYIENQQLDEGIESYRKGLELAPTDVNLRLNLISAFRNAEKFEEAAAEYETLSEGQPDDFGIYRELGKLYLQLDDETRARGAYQRMIDQDPNNAGTHLILAEIYAGHEWFDDAVAAYEQAISLAPKNLDYVEYLGEFYLRQGNREQTVETWHRMVEGNLGIAANYDRLAQLFESKAFRTEAIAASREAVALRPDEYLYREALARLLMEHKEYDEALTQYTEAAKLAPNEFFAEHAADQQIEIYRRQGTLVEKLEALEAAPERFDQQKQLAKMYLKLGNTSYAIEVLTKAKTFQPNDVRVNRWLAELYARQGHHDEGVATYAHLVEIDPGNAREYYTEISHSHLNVMDFEAATDAAKQAIAHSPRNPEGHQVMAAIAKQAGDYETATNSLKQAIRLRPEATDTRAELAAVYKLSGSFRQAIEQYWRCWELSDSVGDKLRFVKSLSEAYYDLGRGDEFQEQLKHKAKANSSDTAPILALAELYRMEGDLLGARFQLVQALEQDPENPDLLGQLVKISLNLGDTQDALSYQRQLVKVQPDPTHQQRLGELLFDAGREQEAIQAWTKLLHAKNQALEAEVSLAKLLIRYGLLEEALSVLDRAGEKAKDAKAVYQIGAMLVEMNESDRARPHFERILHKSKLPEYATQQGKITNRRPSYGPPGINTRKFNLVSDLALRIQPQRFGRRQSWRPRSFEEAQAGALVHLMTFAQKHGELDTFIQQLEAEANANPRDIQSLERLAQIYTLTRNTDKVVEITNRLIVASPNELTYRGIRLDQLMWKNPNYETLKKALDEITGLTPKAQHWYMAQNARRFYRQGREADATKLLVELEAAKVTDLNVGFTVVDTLVSMGKLDVAERVIAQLPVPNILSKPQAAIRRPSSMAQQQLQQYNRIYQPLANAYILGGQTDKGVELFWAFFDRTKPNVTNVRRVARLASSRYSYGGYSPIQTSYPSPTTYYTQNRLRYLQQVFLQLWTQEQLGALYAKLQSELEATQGRNRIYPSLALSYCYWWEGKRDKAQEILAALQREFPDDLTLKLNTVFVSVQTGQHETALKLLDELVVADPRNRRQYYDLTLQLAVHSGNTVRVRELMTKMLNSPGGARELYQFSKNLQENGLTQYAIAVAQKAASLAMGQRDPNFLLDLSEHLEELGRGLDAARIAERAVRFTHQVGQYGQTLRSWQFQKAMNLVRRSKAVREREPRLVKAVEKNPNSFQAHTRLAAFYNSTNQVQKASTAFDAALALRPKDSMVRQRYAQMLERNGRLAAAADQYIRLLKEHPNALGYSYWEVIETFFRANKVDELVSLAKATIVPTIGQSSPSYFAEEVTRQCSRRNLPKAAAEIYEKIIEVYPNQHNMYAELATAYAAIGERDRAIQFLREKLKTETVAISRNTHTQTAIVSKLIELYKASGQIEELVTEYEAKLALKPENRSLLYLVSAMKIAANDLEGTDPLVNRLLDDATRTMDIFWLNYLADAYRGANDRKREIHLLETATAKLDMRNSWQIPDVYQRLGTAYAQTDEKEKARMAFRKMGAIRLLQRGGGASFWEKAEIAKIYTQHEMWDDAQAMYLEVLNDPATYGYYREQAQEQLMAITQRDREQSSGLETTTQPTDKTKHQNPRLQRALAQQHVAQREYHEAAELYKQIIEAVPQDLESRAQLATVYSHQKQHDAAIAEWQALLALDPENSKYQDGIVGAYEASGDVDMAIELSEQYIKTDENGLHYARLAKLYGVRNRVDDAIKAYEKAIELTPGNGQVYRELAILYIRKNDFDAAEQAFKEALQYTGEEWERRNIQHQIMGLYIRQGKFEEMLQKAEDEGTLTFEMQHHRARSYRIQGKLEKAIEAYKKALNMTVQNSDKDQIAPELIQIYAQLGQTEAALELYGTLAQAAHPGGVSSIRGFNSSGSGFRAQFGSDQARQSLINAYKTVRKLDDLLAYLEQHLATDADNPVTLEVIAEIHRTHGDDAKAADSYQQLCKVQPENVRSFYYAAAAFNKSGQPELAQQMLNEGEAVRVTTRHWNQDMWHLIALGDICVKGELYDAAIQLLEAADTTGRETMVDNFDQQILNHTLAEAYLGAKRYADAAKAFQQLADISGRHREMKRRAEEGLRRAYKEGNLSNELLEGETQSVPAELDDPDTHVALAQAYELKNMPNEAIAAYEQARALNPNSVAILEPLAKLYAKTDPEQAKILYKQLIKLEDTAEARIQHRRTLINLYKRHGEFDAAITELLDTIHFASERIEHSVAFKSLWHIYVAQGRRAEGIATLEDLAAKITDNSALYEVLGDAYDETGESEKASVTYAKWIELRQKEIEREGNGDQSFSFVSKLLMKRIMPEKALELAEDMSSLEGNEFMIPMLAEAYLVNGQYEKAEATFKRALANPELADTPVTLGLWSNVMRSALIIEDTEQFAQLVEALVENTPPNATERVYANLALLVFHHRHNRPEAAEQCIRKSGVVPESAWWIVGPFDKIREDAEPKAHIPEDAVHIDPTVEYEGKTGAVSWEQVTDRIRDGFVDFDDIFRGGRFADTIEQFDAGLEYPQLESGLAYAWVTLNSPDAREAQIRVTNLNTTKVWLNGKAVLTINQGGGPLNVPHHTASVTLNPGANSILVKVSGKQWGWKFNLWLTDPEGKPLEDLTFPKSNR